MSRWFRSYADTHRNPKVARLSDADFRLWHELLCVAAENDGQIPPLDDLKYLLNRRLDHLSKALQRLISGGLIDALEVGYEPRNWDERQYKSDTSTDRVQKFRAKRNVSVTPPDTDTDTDSSVSKDTSPRQWALPLGVSKQVWTDFLKNRKRKRMPNTDTAWKKFTDDLTRVSAATGIPPPQLVEQCTAKGWGGIYDPREDGNGKSGQNGRQPSDGLSQTTRAARDVFGLAAGD